MPHIPTQQRMAPLRAVTGGGAGAGLAIVGEQLERAGEIAFAVEQARTNARREIALNRSLIDFTKSMDDLQLAAEAQTDPDAMRSTWNEQSAKLLTETRDSLADPVVQREFEQMALAFHEQRRIGIERSAWDLTVRTGQATTQERITQLANEAAGARNDVERAAAMGKIQNTIDGAFAAGFYKPGEKAQAERYALGQVEKSDLILGTAALQSARSSGDVNAIAERMAGRIATAEALTPIERAQAQAGLAQDVRITLDRMETQARQYAMESKQASARGWVNRILDPSKPIPSATEILSDQNLDAGAAEHFVELASQRANGVNQNVVDPALANDLYQRIHDTSRPDHITSYEGQILPHVGHGIPMALGEQYRQDIAQQNDPVVKAHDEMLTKFFQTAKAQIVQPPAFGMPDPKGESLYWSFSFEARRRWDEAVKANKDPVATLLDPSSKDFLGNMIRHYQRSEIEKMHDTLPGGGLEIPTAEARQPGESPEDYLKRVGK